MSPYEPQDNFSDINIYDTSDPVIGGVSGVSNDPIKALADRTQYLFNRLGSFLGHRIVNASANITTDDIFKCVKAVVNANISLSLSTVVDYPVGSMILIKVKTTAAGPKCVRIIPAGSEIIERGNENVAATTPTTIKLWLHDGEHIMLMAGDADGNGVSDYWDIVDTNIPFDRIGNDAIVRFQPKNSLVADGFKPEIGGALIQRDDVARLWQKVEGSAIDDSAWLSGIRYQGFFSRGNGTTTMRLPDMRSMTMKALDSGRGISLFRLDPAVGGYEADDIKAHYHDLPTDIEYAGSDSGGEQGSNDKRFISGRTTGTTGGNETLIKNIGGIPIIYY